MRTFAMTGIDTAATISSTRAGSAIRATPPSRRMSAGTRSSAMTATAPASSAIFACSAVVTSMITPPFSIWARRMCWRSAIRSPFDSLMNALLSRFGCLDDRHTGRVEEPRPGRPLLLAPDRLGEPPNALVDAAPGHRGKREPQGLLPAPVDEEGRPRREGDAALHGERQQRAGIEPGRERQEERESAHRLGPRHAVGHAPAESHEEGRPAPPVLGGQAGEVAVQKAPLAEPMHRRLDERARVE